MTNIDSIFKSRNITLPTKVRLAKAMGFVLFCFVFNFIFKLYIIVLVLPNIKMNPPQNSLMDSVGEGEGGKMFVAII